MSRNLIDNFSEILRDLAQYKARTAMTMFGIIWGTMTVIVLLAFGVGLKKQMSINMHGIGEGVVIVWPGRTSIPFEGYGRDRRIRLSEEDVELVRNEVKEIKRISPEFSSWMSPIRVRDKINRNNLTGILPEFGDIRNIWPEPGGRWINDLDIKYNRRVVFLGNRLRDFLFDENDHAIGKYVYINDTPFMVVGVMKPKTQNSSYNSRDQDRAFIPYTTFKSILGARYVSNFVYQIEDPQINALVRKKVYTVLGKKFKFDPDDRETLGIWDTTDFERFLENFSLGFTLFMGIIGVITLIVGGIGLANIMYVVVRERTREIGIRRSVGAKRSHIFKQFIFEAFVVVGIGAFIGFLLAIGLIELVSAVPSQDFKDSVGTPEMNLVIAFATVLILTSIGFLAGLFPARRASKLNIIDCLRY